MNSWTNLNEALSQLPFINDLTEKKAQLDALRPLSQEVEGRVMQKIRLEWNYHSNAIEGNKLTFGETYSFLMYGLTAKGKPLKDHLDIRGHNEAINFLTSLVKDERDLTETDIRDLHRMILVEPYQTKAQTPDGQLTSKTILLGEYKKMPNHVKTPTGEIHYYATPDEVPILMGELMTWYSEAQMNKNIHPSVLAAFFHHRFVAIHPFDDGNGRLGRILMNLILMKNGYPPAVIKLRERTDYYAALGQADKNEYLALAEFVAEAVSDTVSIYLKAAMGDNIEDDDDIDKEIHLFKASLRRTFKHRSIETNEIILLSLLIPIFEKASSKFNLLNDLFENKSTFLQIDAIGRTVETLDMHLYQIENQIRNEDLRTISIIIVWQKSNKSKSGFSLFTYLNISLLDTECVIKIGTHDFSGNNISLFNMIEDFESINFKSIDYTQEINIELINNIANIWVKYTLEELKKAIIE